MAFRKPFNGRGKINNQLSKFNNNDQLSFSKSTLMVKSQNQHINGINTSNRQLLEKKNQSETKPPASVKFLPKVKQTKHGTSSIQGQTLTNKQQVTVMTNRKQTQYESLHELLQLQDAENSFNKIRDLNNQMQLVLREDNGNASFLDKVTAILEDNESYKEQLLESNNTYNKLREDYNTEVKLSTFHKRRLGEHQNQTKKQRDTISELEKMVEDLKSENESLKEILDKEKEETSQLQMQVMELSKSSQSFSQQPLNGTRALTKELRTSATMTSFDQSIIACNHPITRRKHKKECASKQNFRPCSVNSLRSYFSDEKRLSSELNIRPQSVKHTEHPSKVSFSADQKSGLHFACGDLRKSYTEASDFSVANSGITNFEENEHIHNYILNVEESNLSFANSRASIKIMSTN